MGILSKIKVHVKSDGRRVEAKDRPNQHRDAADETDSEPDFEEEWEAKREKRRRELNASRTFRNRDFERDGSDGHAVSDEREEKDIARAGAAVPVSSKTSDGPKSSSNGVSSGDLGGRPSDAALKANYGFEFGRNPVRDPEPPRRGATSGPALSTVAESEERDSRSAEPRPEPSARNQSRVNSDQESVNYRTIEQEVADRVNAAIKIRRPIRKNTETDLRRPMEYSNPPFQAARPLRRKSKSWLGLKTEERYKEPLSQRNFRPTGPRPRTPPPRPPPKSSTSRDAVSHGSRDAARTVVQRSDSRNAEAVRNGKEAINPPPPKRNASVEPRAPRREVSANREHPQRELRGASAQQRHISQVERKKTLNAGEEKYAVDHNDSSYHAAKAHAPHDRYRDVLSDRSSSSSAHDYFDAKADSTVRNIRGRVREDLEPRKDSAVAVAPSSGAGAGMVRGRSTEKRSGKVVVRTPSQKEHLDKLAQQKIEGRFGPVAAMPPRSKSREKKEFRMITKKLSEEQWKLFERFLELADAWNALQAAL